VRNLMKNFVVRLRQARRNLKAPVTSLCHCRVEGKRGTIESREVMRDHRGQSEAKPVGVGAASQRLIPTGERSGLQTHIAATESVTLCARMKKV
jgi:hypothetical protein